MPGYGVAEEGPVCLVASAFLGQVHPCTEVSWVFSQALQLSPGAILRNVLAGNTGAEVDGPPSWDDFPRGLELR